MSIVNEYKSKLCSPDDAVAIVKSGDWVDYGMGLSQPVVLDEALAKRKHELRDVKIRSIMTVMPRQVVSKDPDRETFTYCSWHFSGYDRKLNEQGLCNFIPMIYRNLPSYYRNYLAVDVAMVSVPPMDKHGYFNFSLTNSATRATLETAKKVIVEINENLPIALGGREECIHISEVDYIVAGNNTPAIELPGTIPDEIDQRAARLIVDEIVH